MRVLALDYGSARCGCAVSDPSGTLATPIEPVERPNTRKGLARLRNLTQELEAERVVVGLPIALSGRETDQTQETRQFIEALSERLEIPIETYDERLTTKLAQRLETALTTTSEDSRAAAVLLQNYLDGAENLNEST